MVSLSGSFGTARFSAGPVEAPRDPHGTEYKAAEFIETYTGRPFWPLHPTPENVSIIDIAHNLSNQGRYSGSTGTFYSTAQHCCLLANFVEKQRKGSPLDCLQILMHDCAEAYLVDIPRPVKQYMPEYRQWDKAITYVIRDWLGLGSVPIPDWQDELDSRIIVDERAQLMSDSGLDWGHHHEPLGIYIEPWRPVMAEQQFLMRYASFSKMVFGKHQYLRSGWGVSTHSHFKEFPFRTGGSDIAQKGEVNPRLITDLMEVDLRGGVGRVALRSPNGMMVRDTAAGQFPRPAWKWIHGAFELATPGIEDVMIGSGDNETEGTKQ